MFNLSSDNWRRRLFSALHLAEVTTRQTERPSGSAVPASENNVARGPADRDMLQNWRFFLLHGLFYSLKRRLAPPEFILPFLCVAAGGPVFLSAVIVPFFSMSSYGAELASTPLVAKARQRKHYMSVGVLAVAVGLLLAIAAVEIGVLALTVACLMFSAVFFGAGRGIGGLAHASLMASMFDKKRRTDLINLEAVSSACFAIVVALATYYLFLESDPLKSHLALLWLAFLFAIPAVFLITPIRETVREFSSGSTGGEADTARKPGSGFASRFFECWRSNWFRQYLVMSLLLLSVRQVLPFYTIHAASLHKHQNGSLAAFVVAISVGQVLSGPVLHWMSSVSLGANLAVAIGTAMLAAVFALAVELLLTDPQFYIYMPIFVLVALASQVASVSLRVYLGEVSDEGSREYFMSTNDVTIGFFGAGVAALLGVLAQLNDESVPIAIILGANLIAFGYVLRLRRS